MNANEIEGNEDAVDENQELAKVTNELNCILNKEQNTIGQVLNDLKKDGIKVLPKLNKSGRIEKVYDLARMYSILPIHAVVMAGGNNVCGQIRIKRKTSLVISVLKAIE